MTKQLSMFPLINRDGLPSMIGLYSPMMQSGKTQVANILVQHYGYTLVKFAAPLKAAVTGLLRDAGFDEDTIERMVEGDLKEVPIPGFGDISPRMMMQTAGTEWGRQALAMDLWIKIAFRKALDVILDGGRVVIDDVRFPNEFSAIKAHNDSLLVRVFRWEAPDYSTHSSEGLLEEFDFDRTLVNNGTLHDLRCDVHQMMAEHSCTTRAA